MTDACTCPSCRYEDKTMTDYEVMPGYPKTVQFKTDLERAMSEQLIEFRADKAKLQADVSALEAERDEYRQAWEAAAETVATNLDAFRALHREKEKMEHVLALYAYAQLWATGTEKHRIALENADRARIGLKETGNEQDS